ncbi:hypothetical protein JTE90_024495 [Oedothorax gibbosus]|uniref:Peptidase M12A domain-containing protein n=1 Tax=Oedothorax gibbosus TaxID=931172 RepID=A0AAV6TRU2_9ARAC|nr:hypothetical protein JTE90_024495 [Oedothorax gibbosus]
MCKDWVGQGDQPGLGPRLGKGTTSTLKVFLAIGFACGFPSPKIPDNLNPNIFQYIIEKTEEYLNHLKPLESPYLYHGDILLPREETERVALANVSITWPDGVIPYVVEGLDTLKDGIKTAMKHIMDKTCIKFVPWDGKKKDYVKIKCSSYVGRIGGSQRIYLDSIGCPSPGDNHPRTDPHNRVLPRTEQIGSG